MLNSFKVTIWYCRVLYNIIIERFLMFHVCGPWLRYYEQLSESCKIVSWKNVNTLLKSRGIGVRKI